MGIWSSFVNFLEWILLEFSILTGSTAIGIILFTILARLAMLPLTLKSIQSSRKMQELQPLIKELQRKHGKDAKKLQEETVKLYQQYRINPVGGCLPMLLQLPIFFGVYQAVIHLMVPAYFESRGEAIQQAVQDPAVAELLTRPFLGLNLGVAPFGDDGFNGAIYLILPIFSVVSQLVMQLMAMPRVQDPQQKAMSQAMLVMPFVFGYIAFTFPAGAVLYWVTSSTIGIIQQYITSGWGSLANYLKFLPADRTRKPTVITATDAPASPENVSAQPEREATVVRQKTNFWAVLRPLTELNTAEGGVAASVDSATEQALEETRRQVRAKPNPRRPRRRR